MREEGVEFGYKVLLTEFAIAVLINVFMNLHWAILVVNQVIRVL